MTKWHMAYFILLIMEDLLSSPIQWEATSIKEMKWSKRKSAWSDIWSTLIFKFMSFIWTFFFNWKSKIFCLIYWNLKKRRRYQSMRIFRFVPKLISWSKDFILLKWVKFQVSRTHRLVKFLAWFAFCDF